MDVLVDQSRLKPLKKNGPTREIVRSIHHWTNSLFSFRITRPAGFRFRSGEFVMIGLETGGKPLLRAYSVASPSWDEELEFFSIKVPGGPLTSRLQNIQIGDEILLSRKPTGTLVLDALLPGKKLYLFSTGTGFAPFASVIRDPETYEQYDHIIVTHTCRRVAELEYSQSLIRTIKADPLLSEITAGKLTYYDSITREDYVRTGRITTLIKNGKLFNDLKLLPLNPQTDRVMICGAVEMNKEISVLCEEAGLTEGSNAAPAEFVVEKAFVG